MQPQEQYAIFLEICKTFSQHLFNSSGNTTPPKYDSTINNNSGCGITNGFGQTTVQAQASTTGFIYTRSEFNAKGQLTKQYQDTGWNTEKTAATLYEYDSFGNVSKQTLALSSTPTKDNSPVVEMAYSVESAEDGVYSVTTQTRYNAEGTALTSAQKQLISQMSESLEQKTITVNERGLTSINYTLYTMRAPYQLYWRNCRTFAINSFREIKRKVELNRIK